MDSDHEARLRAGRRDSLIDRLGGWLRPLASPTRVSGDVTAPAPAPSADYLVLVVAFVLSYRLGGWQTRPEFGQWQAITVGRTEEEMHQWLGDACDDDEIRLGWRERFALGRCPCLRTPSLDWAGSRRVVGIVRHRRRNRGLLERRFVST